LRVDDPLPVAAGAFDLGQASAVYDMIYQPAETAFVAGGASGGLPDRQRSGHVLYQGARALEIWTGQPPRWR
jgi:shikimate dehydrogenase